MLTETQKRVARAQALLDSGMEPRAVARECGYKNVNGMMGAIALHGRRIADVQREEEAAKQEAAPVRQAPVYAAAQRSMPENKNEPTVRAENKSEPEQNKPVFVPAGTAQRAWEPRGEQKSEKDVVVETGGVRLRYNPETDSVLLTMNGNTKYLWIGRRGVPAAKLMRSLRNAAGAMAVTLEENSHVYGD